jgi:hypothetical protein
VHDLILFLCRLVIMSGFDYVGLYGRLCCMRASWLLICTSQCFHRVCWFRLLLRNSRGLVRWPGSTKFNTSRITELVYYIYMVFWVGRLDRASISCLDSHPVSMSSTIVSCSCESIKACPVHCS